MTRTFGLELSENVLTNYTAVFYKYPPFRTLLKAGHILDLILIFCKSSLCTLIKVFFSVFSCFGLILGTFI